MPKIAKPFITHAKDSPAYWQVGNLWQIMATGVQTDNSFALLDQVLLNNGGAVTHTHTQDEGLYVISGKCVFNAGAHQGLPGTPGTFVAIPGDTEHSFTVIDPDTHVLNFYLPAGFEQLMIGISHPAEERKPPPREKIRQMLPPKSLSAKLALDDGQGNIMGDPFTGPPDPNKMMTRPTPGATVFPFTANLKENNLQSYWLMGGLWSTLASGTQTGKSYCLIEQRLRKGPVVAPPLRVNSDEVYCILDGEMSFLLDDRIERAAVGDLVFIPRGSVRGVRVESEEAHCLNLHTPSGFEELVELMGSPATENVLPLVSFEDKEVDAGMKRRLLDKLGVRAIAVADPLS